MSLIVVAAILSDGVHIAFAYWTLQALPAIAVTLQIGDADNRSGQAGHRSDAKSIAPQHERWSLNGHVILPGNVAMQCFRPMGAAFPGDLYLFGVQKNGRVAHCAAVGLRLTFNL